jgi:hypothetical protein
MSSSPVVADGVLREELPDGLDLLDGGSFGLGANEVELVSSFAETKKVCDDLRPTERFGHARLGDVEDARHLC